MRSSFILSALIATSAFFLGSALSASVLGPWPWWVTLALGLVNTGLAFALRHSLHDHLLAQSLGMDAIVRHGRTPRILTVNKENAQ